MTRGARYRTRDQWHEIFDRQNEDYPVIVCLGKSRENEKMRFYNSRGDRRNIGQFEMAYVLTMYQEVK